ncbi:hypothetical protein LR004_03345 [Candidatus Gracilibacteria bacterium]|nr:hypothetical protein [Candidatus Gracilibacteria bacterium]
MNPTSVVLYLLVVILLSFITANDKYSTTRITAFINNTLLFVITLFTIIGGVYSYKFYISETLTFQNRLNEAINAYPFNSNNHFYSGNFDTGLSISGIKTPIYFSSKIYYEGDNESKKIVCDEYINNYNFAETYFYCGDIFWDLGDKEAATNYYKQGLNLLPDLWNKNSDYYNKFLIKHFNITGNRFLSEKYGLAQILERVGIINK